MTSWFSRHWFKTLFVSLLVVAVFTFSQQPLVSQTPASFPMGGKVLTVLPCNTGILITTGPPTPGVWMDLPIALFGYKVPTMPGLNILGKSSTFVEPCFVGPVPTGAGFRLMYSGTSGAPSPI
tara:strand:+ start:1188 stop:1556 length:369 start_codon:yes stop_codon:yes gene_type:complete